MDSAEQLCERFARSGVKAEPCNGGTAVHLTDEDGQQAWMNVRNLEIYSSTIGRIDPVDDLMHFYGSHVRDFERQVRGWIILWQSGREQFADLLTTVVFN